MNERICDAGRFARLAKPGRTIGRTAPPGDWRKPVSRRLVRIVGHGLDVDVRLDEQTVLGHADESEIWSTRRSSPVPRFPPSKVGRLVTVVNSKLQSYGMFCGFGRVERGINVIVLQALLDRGLSPSSLTMPMDDYVALSVGQR